MKIERLLKIALRANGVFSGTTGLAALFASETIAGFLGVQPPLIVSLVGLNLAGFAAILFYISGRERTPAYLIRTIIGLDLAWVAGSGLLIGLGLLSTTGAIVAGIVALLVFDFAVVQYFGLRKSLQAEAAA